MAGKKWTKEEEEYLLKNYKKANKFNLNNFCCIEPTFLFNSLASTLLAFL